MKRLLPFLALLLAAPLAADIAVFSGGRTLKVSGYDVSGDTIALTLAAGGTMTVPIERIERIVDDEIVPAAVVEEVVQSGGEIPARSWGFSESRVPMFHSKYDALIIAAARKWNVDATLVSAVIKAESDYQPNIVSHKGARGLMQLMPGTAKRFGVTNSFDPADNIYGGTRYLRWLLDKFEGNADHAVAAYNAGEGNVWKYKGIPPFRETINYVKKIGKHLRNADSAHSRTVATVAAAK